MTPRFWHLVNPNRFEKLTRVTVPYLTVVTIFSLVIGLTWGFVFTGNENIQGSTVKIIFLHVPSAVMAINCWLMMLVSSLIWLIRRHRVSVLAAKAAAPVGFAMTLITLVTGALWGQPIWGTYWAWDPRLTSFFILFLHYMTYMLLWNFITNRELACELTSILCLVGTVFALLSRYAVLIWTKGIHQGASLSLDRETNIHNEYYVPLLICMFGFLTLFVVLVLLRTRTEIMKNKIRLKTIKGVQRWSN